MGDPELCSVGWGPSWDFELAETSAREMNRSANVSMMIGVEAMISAILGFFEEPFEPLKTRTIIDKVLAERGVISGLCFLQ